jgi:hypothetical protein
MAVAVSNGSCCFRRLFLFFSSHCLSQFVVLILADGCSLWLFASLVFQALGSRPHCLTSWPIPVRACAFGTASWLFRSSRPPEMPAPQARELTEYKLLTQLLHALHAHSLSYRSIGHDLHAGIISEQIVPCKSWRVQCPLADLQNRLIFYVQIPLAQRPIDMASIVVYNRGIMRLWKS